MLPKRPVALSAVYRLINRQQAFKLFPNHTLIRGRQIGLLSWPCRFQGTTATGYGVKEQKQYRPVVVGTNVGPLKHYNNLLNSGVLQPDIKQFAAVKKLQDLFNSINDVDEKIPADIDKANLQAPKGLYIHGEVGTGKTVLLDIIYNCLPDGSKKRVHFHNFLLHLYSEFNKWNLCLSDKNERMDLTEPTEFIADQLLDNANIICFDEIQVADYGSCSLLQAVFKHLFLKGAVVVGTSNRSIENLGDTSISEISDGEHPIDDIFESVRSFKGLLQSNCEALHLDSSNDYRMKMKPGKTTYFSPIDDATEERLDQSFSEAVGKGNPLSSQFISVYGRNVLVPIASTNGVARFTAKELFDQPLGPADYIQICNNYHTIFLDRIFKMSLQQRNQARRLLSFIDAAYESKTKVFCTAETKVEDLFTMLPRDASDAEVDGYEDQMHFEMIGEIAYDLALSEFDFRSLGIITGDDEIFSFRRAISRLTEMQSLLYQTRPHRAQVFDPYTGTAEEKSSADDNRRDRMNRRKQLLEEIEAKRNDDFSELRNIIDESIDDKANGDKSTQALEHRLRDMDWGDEASYRTLSQTIVKKRRFDETMQKLAEKRMVKQPAPRFGEKHFWGFGWWDKAIKRIKGDKPDDKEK